MKIIDKENLKDFLLKYDDLHDSNFVSINYNIIESKVELVIDALKWEVNESQSIRVKVKLVFNNVKELKLKELFSWDFVYEIILEKVKIENDDAYLFCDDKDSPALLIICETIQWEEI